VKIVPSIIDDWQLARRLSLALLFHLHTTANGLSADSLSQLLIGQTSGIPPLTGWEVGVAVGEISVR